MAFLLTGVSCGTTVTLAAGNLWFVSKLRLRNCNHSVFSGFSDERIHPSGAGERSKRGWGTCGHGGPQVGGACLTQCEVQTEFIQWSKWNNCTDYNIMILISYSGKRSLWGRRSRPSLSRCEYLFSLQEMYRVQVWSFLQFSVNVWNTFSGGGYFSVFIECM